MATHQGKTVTVVRAAQQGDQGYNANEKQSLVRYEDGTEKVVRTADVTAN